MNTCEKIEGDLLIKCLQMNKQLHNEIRSESYEIKQYMLHVTILIEIET